MPVAVVSRVAAEVGGVDEGGAGRVQLGHEGVAAARVGGLERIGGGEVGRIGVARDVGVSGGVHGDAVAAVVAAAAEVGGVDEGGAGRVQLGHEGVGRRRALAAWSGLGGGEVGRVGVARDVGVPRAVHGDGTEPGRRRRPGRLPPR